jgi:hypothetical protein
MSRFAHLGCHFLHEPEELEVSYMTSVHLISGGVVKRQMLPSWWDRVPSAVQVMARSWHEHGEWAVLIN